MTRATQPPREGTEREAELQPERTAETLAPSLTTRARRAVCALNNFDTLRTMLAAFVDAAGNPPPELLVRAAALLATIDRECGK